MVIAIFVMELIFQSEFKMGEEAYQKNLYICQVVREGHSEEWTTVSHILPSFPSLIKSSYGKKNHVFNIIPKGHYFH